MTMILPDVLPDLTSAGCLAGPPGETLGGLLACHGEVIATHVRNLKNPDLVSEAVHQIRSSCKKVRSLAGLAEDYARPSALKRVLRCVRKIKDEVADARDRDVLLLRTREFSDEVGKLSKTPACPPETIKKIRKLSEELVEGIAALELEGLVMGDVLNAISRTYSQTWKHFQECRKDRGDEALHNWRKKVKDLQFQCGAFRDVPLLAGLAFRASCLAKTLGDQHDYAVTEQHHLGKKKPKKPVLKAIAEKKRSTTRAAMAWGKDIFQLTPWEFHAGLSRLEIRGA